MSQEYQASTKCKWQEYSLQKTNVAVRAKWSHVDDVRDWDNERDEGSLWPGSFCSGYYGFLCERIRWFPFIVYLWCGQLQFSTPDNWLSTMWRSLKLPGSLSQGTGPVIPKASIYIACNCVSLPTASQLIWVFGITPNKCFLNHRTTGLPGNSMSGSCLHSLASKQMEWALWSPVKEIQFKFSQLHQRKH